MRLFAEVVKQGSYTRAAEYLGVSKGYLSKQVRQLETQLSTQLLVRNTRVMRLTSAGEIVYQQALQLTNFWQQTQALLKASEGELSGIVKCTAPIGVARYSLWPIFNNIMQTQADIAITVDSGNTTHNLVADDFDFAVRLTNTPPQDMIAKHLTQVNYICCASPAFISKMPSICSPLQLTQGPCLVLSHWNEWSFTLNGELLKLKPNSRFVASDNDLLKEACLNGLGIARLPDYMVNKELASGQLVNLFPNIQGDFRQLYLIYPQLSARPKRVAICLEAIADSFA